MTAGHALLEGKTVVVTAAAGTGIGYAAAKRCLEEGATVMISDIHERRLAEAAASLAEVGGTAPASHLCNVTKEDDVQGLIDAAVGEMGRLDVLINNAGLGGFAHLTDMTDEQWQVVLDVTLNGTFRMTRAALRHMLPRKAGVIVNNASVLGWRAQPGQAHYAAAKAGVMALTRCAAMEAAPAGVRINAVAPSLAMHEFLSKVTPAGLLEELVQKEALGRAAEPSEVANVMVFLASDYSSYMTGEVVAVSSQHPLIAAPRTMTPAESSMPVLVERRGHVAVVTLNRPERRNTITRAMLVGLSGELRACEDDPEVRAIVITGAGRAFSAGLDLDDASSDEGIERGGFELGPRFETRDFPPCVLLSLDTPVVCALNGAAAGFGMDLALACDLRVAARGAKLAAAFVRRGVLPESGGTWLLPRLIGWGRAADLFLRGRTIEAEECLRLGLVEHVVDDGEALTAALEIADEIAANAPLAVQATKRMMRSGLADEFDEHVRRVYLQMLPLLGTDDFAEGVRSFLEKRPPVFRGK